MRATRASSLPLLCAVLLGLGACSNEVVKKVGEMTDRACACRDAACADKIEKEYYELAKTPAKGTQGERDEVKEHYNRMRECIARARSGAEAQPKPGATPPPTDPAGPAGQEKK